MRRTHSRKPTPKRMSILTNSVLDLPTFITESSVLEYGAPQPNGRKRKFFQSKLPQWEDHVRKMLVAGESVHRQQAVSQGISIASSERLSGGRDYDWDDETSIVMD